MTISDFQKRKSFEDNTEQLVDSPWASHIKCKHKLVHLPWVKKRWNNSEPEVLEAAHTNDPLVVALRTDLQEREGLSDDG